jgi:hypothetical protein
MTLTRDATPPLIDDIATSAPVPLSDVIINADIMDDLPPVTAGDASVFFSTDAQATWTDTLLDAVTGSPDTWEATYPMPDGELLYYFLVASDSAATFTAPKNYADVFPPPVNLMVDPADEPAGDAVNINTHALDLTGARFGYSDDYIYASLSNATGSWPTSGGFFGPWYIYSALVGNPDAQTDSIALAMVYADVPLLVSTGLFAIDGRDTSFVRVGDIEADIVGGELHMRCSIADLVAHPDFGPDNPSGYYGAGAGTATSIITGARWTNDQTNTYAFYQRSDGLSPGANTAPGLTDPFAEPVAGVFPDTLIRFEITYTDTDGHLATVRDIVIDGDAHVMDCPGPDRDYAAGVAFELEIGLEPGDHEYYFSFSDGALVVETTPASVTSGTGIPNDGPLGALALHSAWPQPCSSELRLSFSMAERRAGQISIYSTTGRLVRRLWTGGPGEHEETWNVKDDAGARVASGVYFVVLSDGRVSDQKKVVVLR